MAPGAGGWRTTCTRCDVHLCEACEQQGRHAWSPEHVRLRKMGNATTQPSCLAVETSLTMNATTGCEATSDFARRRSVAVRQSAGVATFMLNATSGRTGFDVNPFVSNTATTTTQNTQPLYNFSISSIPAAMNHSTSGRIGFAPLPEQPWQPNFGWQPAPFGGGQPPPSA